MMEATARDAHLPMDSEQEHKHPQSFPSEAALGGKREGRALLHGTNNGN